MARQRAAVDIDRTAGDAVLATQATAGSLAAFEELYRRHAQAAWRVAQSVTRNPDDAADAVSEAFAKVLKAVATGRLTEAERFRSYLLTASRNAALDVARRTGRVRPTDEARALDGPASGGATASDAVVDGFDQQMVASAFDSLPERWRSVLWLTEVEGIPAREAAGLLGVSANGVAQLAVRARAGLRERFLQAHLRSDVDAGCRYTVEHLGAYVAGGLSPRDIAKVDQHLAACDECRARKEELEDLGSSLRRIVLPFPLGLAALSLGKWKATAAVGAGAAGLAKDTPAWLLKAQRPLAVASVAMFAAGIVGVGVVGQTGLTPRDGRSRSDVPQQTVAAPTVNFTPAAAVSAGFGGGAGGSGTGGSGFSGAADGGDDVARGADSGAGSTPGDANGNGTDNGSGDGEGSFRLDTPTNTIPGPTTGTTTASNPPPTPPTTQRPAVQTGIHIGSASVGIGSGTGSQTGVANGGSTVAGTPPAPPQDHDTLTVDAGGTQLDPVVGNDGHRLAI
jgi:RNA polymerase sigma factor (sigma-70 family)